MFIHKKNGFTVLEAVVAIAIISFVLVTSITLLINILNQNKAQQAQLNAIQYATMIRDDLQIDLLVTEASSLIGKTPLDSTNYTTSTLGITSIVINDAFNQASNPFYDKTIITFIDETFYATLNLTIINFMVQIEYYPNRTLTIEGVLYG
jgi:type II secretory pathway pseudopilin PulG